VLLQLEIGHHLCRAIMRRGHTMSGTLNRYVANEKGMMPNALATGYKKSYLISTQAGNMTIER
jgi:hypothetical protein